MIKSLLPTAVVLASLASAPALAQTSTGSSTGSSGQTQLNIEGRVAPYCSVRLANVSSETVSVAMGPEQEIANLVIACNQSSGTRFSVAAANGDLQSGVNRINYSYRIDSPEDASFTFGPTDTQPGQAPQSRSRNGYSQVVANGADLKMFLNVNRGTGNSGPDGSSDGGTDNASPGSQTLFPANSAPAGTYTEVFTFSVSAV